VHKIIHHEKQQCVVCRQWRNGNERTSYVYLSPTGNLGSFAIHDLRFSRRGQQWSTLSSPVFAIRWSATPDDIHCDAKAANVRGIQNLVAKSYLGG